MHALPSPTKFPKFDPATQASVPQESSLFVNEFVTKNLDLRDMLDANFTFLNTKLASLYQITGVTGDKFQRVDLQGNQKRGGILTQATYLIATSKPLKATLVPFGLPSRMLERPMNSAT